jgi:hypothetical protein
VATPIERTGAFSLSLTVLTGARTVLASATTPMSASAKPICTKAKSSGKARAKAAPKAKMAKKPKAPRTARGRSQPLTEKQYDALLEWTQWRYPRAPEKRSAADKMPKELASRVAALFRSTKNFGTQPSAFLERTLLVLNDSCCSQHQSALWPSRRQDCTRGPPSARRPDARQPSWHGARHETL